MRPALLAEGRVCGAWGSKLSCPPGQIHLGITGTCRSKRKKKRSRRRWQLTFLRRRRSTRERAASDRILPAVISSSKYHQQISDLIIGCLSSPRCVLAFPHSHPLQSPTRIAAFHIHAGFCDFFSLPHFNLTIYQLCIAFPATAAVLHCTFVTCIYTELPNTKQTASIHWDFCFLSLTRLG